jgi:hypothetical protein
VKDEIEERFAENLERVQHLVDVYAATAPGPGRRDVKTTDILRAAVVFLHATLEDLLRSLLAWRLPMAAAEHLKDVPLEGKEARTKFTLDELAVHRGKTVDAVIAGSVLASLEESSFSHPGEVDRALEKVGLPKGLVDPFRPRLAPMMKRRHWIVHRADRNLASGAGHHPARSLQLAVVEDWYRAVGDLGALVLSKV